MHRKFQWTSWKTVTKQANGTFHSSSQGHHSSVFCLKYQVFTHFIWSHFLFCCDHFLFLFFLHRQFMEQQTVIDVGEQSSHSAQEGVLFPSPRWRACSFAGVLKVLQSPQLWLVLFSPSAFWLLYSHAYVYLKIVLYLYGPITVLVGLG